MNNRTQRTLNTDQAQALARDLITALSDRIGDREAVDTELARWAQTLGPTPFAQVCIAGMQATFRDCLSLVSLEDWPAQGVTLRSLDGAA